MNEKADCGFAFTFALWVSWRLGALAVQNVLGVLRTLAVHNTFTAPEIAAANP
jgi:hypothetical protein